MRAGRVLLLAIVLVAGCATHDKAPAVQPAAPASPKASPPAGFVNTTRCNALRVTIRSNEQALAVEQAAGHAEAVAQLHTKISADLAAARAIAGCNTSDLASP